MKKLLLILVALFLFVGCGHQEDQAVKVASDYVNKSILPILPNYCLSTQIVPRVRFLKRTQLEQLNVISELKKYSLDYLEYKINNTYSTIDIEDVILSAINANEIDAFSAVDSEEGFYDVIFCVEDKNDPLKSHNVIIIVSKDLRVINEPIDNDTLNTLGANLKI